jgi:crotonobetainyl-CoA:carnitine CoA-transferase CaiB-like acyl-CoA transferase
MSATPTGSALPAPSLGEHTAAILRALGLGNDAMQRLARDGVIRCLD